jgi:hypothetical protein
MTFYGNSESGNGATVIDRNAFNGGNGPGGAIVLIVGGNLTIGASGSILAQGARAEGVNYTNNTDWYSTGGGAGGGIILIAHKGTYTNGGTVSCAALGGGRFTQNGGGIYNPGSQSSGSSSIAYGGGDGSVQVVNIS